MNSENNSHIHFVALFEDSQVFTDDGNMDLGYAREVSWFEGRKLWESQDTDLYETLLL